jgi:large subunit ribosomal protein L18e
VIYEIIFKKIIKIIKRSKMKYAKNSKLKAITTLLWAQKGNAWKAIAAKLDGPTSNLPIVNVSKLDKIAKEGFILLVPGKILAGGDVENKIEVAAYQISATAKEKILAKGGKVYALDEVAKKNTDAKKVIIVG